MMTIRTHRRILMTVQKSVILTVQKTQTVQKIVILTLCTLSKYNLF